MDITCISDLHGHYPKLEGGDLLIVAGDLTARDEHEQYEDFAYWLYKQEYKKKILISGNHDNFLEKTPDYFTVGKFLGHAEYLCDSVTEFEGLKIWGSPWTLKFPGMNPHCMAFTCDTEEELADKWVMIPEDTDILITHSPAYGILDQVEIYGHERDECNEAGLDTTISVGSKSLRQPLYAEKIKPKLHVFGHIHDGYGSIPKMLDFPNTYFVNASHINEHYQPVNKPVRVIL